MAVDKSRSLFSSQENTVCQRRSSIFEECYVAKPGELDNGIETKVYDTCFAALSPEHIGFKPLRKLFRNPLKGRLSCAWVNMIVRRTAGVARNIP